MINDKDKENIKSALGKLMLRRIMLVDCLDTYIKELKQVDEEINKICDKYTGVKENGGTVQQAQ